MQLIRSTSAFDESSSPSDTDRVADCAIGARPRKGARTLIHRPYNSNDKVRYRTPEPGGYIKGGHDSCMSPTCIQVAHRLLKAHIRVLMGFFGKNQTYDDLAEQVATLSVAVDKVERNFRNLELDYLQTYDKVKRLMSRVAKRAAIDQPNDDQGELPIDDKFSHLDPISAEIMRRRANGVR